MLRIVVIVAAVVWSPRAFAGRCDAHGAAEDYAILDADDAPHSELELGARAASVHSGEVHDTGYGGAFAAGLRWDRVAVLGEYQLLDFETWPRGPTPDPLDTTFSASGHAQHVGAIARYSFGRIREARLHNECRLDAFVEIGAGEQLVHWSAGGGEMHQADFTLGARYAVLSRGRRFHGGYTINVRDTWAPQSPSRGWLDHTVVLDISFVFGG